MSDEQTNQTTETTSADAQPPEVTTPASEVGTTAVGEPQAQNNAGDAGNQQPSVSSLPSAENAPTPSEDTSPSATADLGNASAASSSSVADAAPVSLSSAPAAVTAEDPNVNLQTSAHEWTPEQLAQIQANGNPPATASASSAAAQPENGMQSSASTAQQNVATQGISAFESHAKGALASLQRLREHLWTFEHSAVAHLHAEIDKLESIFR